MGMEQLIDKSKHLIFERDTYQANIKALQQDMKDKKRIVLFVGAGINLGGNNDIDISWNGLLNMMLKDALSILTAEKRYTIQERERLESLLCSSKRISQRTEEEQLLWETLHGTVEGEFTSLVRASIIKSILGKNIIRILDLLNTILVMCRCSVLCLITCFFNYTALYLLPLAIIVDWGIFQYSVQSVFKSQLMDLNKAVNEFKKQGADLEIIEDEIIKEIDTEMRKYQLFQWGNRQGDKRTIVIRANKLFGQFKSFAFYNASSFIFVPKTFYPQSMKDRILLAHEFAHCVSHDLMLAFKRQFYCSAIILPLFVLVSDIPAWMKISAILLASVLALLQFWPIVYNEIIANNHALEVVNTLYGAKSMSESAKYLLKVRTETLRKNIKDKRYGLAYAIEELQIEHLQRSVSENALIQQSSPMNVWLSIIHYSLFALAGYACYSFVKEMNVSWYMLIMALIAFILIYVLSKINVTKIWIIKNLIYEKIGIQ